MSHSLPTAPAVGQSGNSSGSVLGWNSGPSGAGLTNPFAAFTVVAVKPGEDSPGSAVAAAVFAAGTRSVGEDGGASKALTSLDEIPKAWWKVVENERGGYQYKTVTKVLDKSGDVARRRSRVEPRHRGTCSEHPEPSCCPRVEA